jgi:hypothetical protein
VRKGVYVYETNAAAGASRIRTIPMGERELEMSAEWNLRPATDS